MSALSIAPAYFRHSSAWARARKDAWIEIAQHAYGFDQATAERFVFIAWLVESGRLSDW